MMASRSEGLEVFTCRRSGIPPCPRAVTLCSAFCSPVVLVELEFNEFSFLPCDLTLSTAALVIKACLRSSLAVLVGAEELAGLPPEELDWETALVPLTSLIAAGPRVSGLCAGDRSWLSPRAPPRFNDICALVPFGSALGSPT